jgi:retron-type reverse transcriptase
MRRKGNLYSEITSFESLLNASKKARRSKRYRHTVLAFHNNLEAEIFQLQQELQTRTYRPGTPTTFYIYEPKPRLISAAPYRDRVVHHALFKVINPIFEPTFDAYSFANRVGYGTHAALRHFTKLCRSHDYILHCDIRRYFANIDHEILKTKLHRKIRCPDTLWLIDTLIDASNPQESDHTYFPGDDLFTPFDRRKGLPIGNLTSQFFANLYLSDFDRFIHRTLHITAYLRYMDDFALFSNDPSQLDRSRRKIETYLETHRLQIHPIKSQRFKTTIGANFVGFRVFPRTIRIRADSLRRSHRRFDRLCNQTSPDIEHILRSLQSWNNHLTQGTTWKLRQKILTDFPAEWFTKTGVDKPKTRRLLDQQSEELSFC